MRIEKGQSKSKLVIQDVGVVWPFHEEVIFERRPLLKVTDHCHRCPPSQVVLLVGLSHSWQAALILDVRKRHQILTFHNGWEFDPLHRLYITITTTALQSCFLHTHQTSNYLNDLRNAKLIMPSPHISCVPAIQRCEAPLLSTTSVRPSYIHEIPHEHHLFAHRKASPPIMREASEGTTR